MNEEKEFIPVGEEFWMESLISSKKLIQCYGAMISDRIEFDEVAQKMRILEEPLNKKLAKRDRNELAAMLCSRATGILQRDANEEAVLAEEEREEIQNLLDTLISDHFANWLFLSLAKTLKVKKKRK